MNFSTPNSVIADEYYNKNIQCERLADHYRMTGQIGLARQYEESAKFWRSIARKLRNG